MYICEICYKSFPTKHLKKNHGFLHNRILWHECVWNGLIENKPSKKELTKHYINIKNKCDNILFKNIIKDKLFYKKLYLNDPKNHKILNDPQNHTIKYNHKKYSNKQRSEENYRFNKNKEPLKVYKCNICAKIMKHKGSLKEHFRTFHTQIKKNCPICNREFRSLQSLKKHINSAFSREFDIL